MKTRIKEARESRGITAPRLAEMLQVHPSTLNNWEAGRRQITLEKLVQIADELGFSVGYLLGRDFERLPPGEPVGMESLPVLHGHPVWAADYGWMLVNIVEKAFVLADRTLVGFDKAAGPIYLIPPALSVSLRGIGKPLGIDELLARERVWVEPVTADTDLAGFARGWYSLYDKRLVQNEQGNRFYIDAYGVKWLAFDDCIGG